MQQASFIKRFIIPTAVVLITMLASLAIYNASGRIGNDSVHQVVAYVSAVVHLLILWIGASIIYPWAFFRGADATERIIACLITPVVWTIMEMFRVSEFFTFGESLYYGLNSNSLFHFTLAILQMGFWELICRWWSNKRLTEKRKIISIAPVVSILVGLLGFYVILIWGLGVHWFYIYQQGYRALFH
jgi:hypothetical protein